MSKQLNDDYDESLNWSDNPFLEPSEEEFSQSVIDEDNTAFADVEDASATEKEDDDDNDKAVFWVRFIKTAGMFAIAFVLFLFAVIAWFVMNKNVGTNGMGVTGNGSAFELAVVENPNNIGAKSYITSGTWEEAVDDEGTSLHDLTGGMATSDGILGTFTYITDLSNGTTSTGNFYTTNGSNDVIKWRLGSLYDKTNDGIGPASYGVFSFYVVPKRAGSQTLRFKVNMEGYKAGVEKNITGSYRVNDLEAIEETDPEYVAVEYLNTHLLFFTNRTGEGTSQSPYYYSGLIGEDGFEMTFDNCEVDKLIPVTVYWIWPNTFAEMTCIASSGNVAVPDSQASIDLRKHVTDNCDRLLKMNPTTALSYMADASGEPGEEEYSFNPTKAENKLLELSISYNEADQSIGTTVKYFLLVLTAE